jgi:DNA-binding NtrC family response regulator
LIELNCANLPDQLVEAELFGHRKGAFTGADHDRKGLFEEADGGILFLDEIGDIPPTVQNRLLKAIEEKQIKRLGTNHFQYFDVQIIAATSRNLPKMIQDGEFREDLYCRLAVLTVEASPLRERREDIPAMIDSFLGEAAKAARPANQSELYRIDETAVELLCGLDYPGNIRTLRNLVYCLTSYVDDDDMISLELAHFALARLNSRGDSYVAKPNNDLSSTASTRFGNALTSVPEVRNINSSYHQSFLCSLAKDGDIILPLDLCILRSGETFKQWTARAKRSSIEAARQATGGTMQTVAERLGLTRSSLKGHLQRAKRAQIQAVFDWQRESD